MRILLSSLSLSSSKSISSPSRTEKYPRFLRSDGNSRSRRRSKATPLFFRKKSRTSSIETTQEPSSPKVTCIGQVRVRRSKNNNNNKTMKRSDFNLCLWFRKTAVFNCRWRWKWRRRRVQTVASSSKNGGSSRFEETREFKDEKGSSSPPKNALLLTRSRSSSLATKFWIGENGESRKEIKNMVSENKAVLLFNNRDSTAECRGERGGSNVSEESNVGDLTAVKNESELMKLRRCKSEPSRRDLEDFDPQSSEYWRLRRLGNTSSTP